MRELFKSNKQYEKYLHAKERAERVNAYLDSDEFIVFDEEANTIESGRFVFGDKTNPMIGLKNRHYTCVFIGREWYENGKIYVPSKKVIDKYFNRLYVFEKKDKKEIK